MAKSTAPLASEKHGPYCINQKGRKEDTILSGTDGDKMKNTDIRISEQPRTA